MSDDQDQLPIAGVEATPAVVEDQVPQLRPLTDRDRAIIEFERLVWGYAGAKDGAFLERFDRSPTRYRQLLSWLLDHPEAEVYDPTTVRRLRRLRDLRRGVRTGAVRAEDVPSSGSLTLVPQTGLRPRHEFR